MVRMSRMAVSALVFACVVVLEVAQPIGQDSQAPGSTATDQKAALMSEGQDIHGQCVECHADGGVGPTFRADARLADRDNVIKQILRGSANGEMPAFEKDLTDRQLAAVATFVRNSWDNGFGVVLETDVARVRGATKDKQ